MVICKIAASCDRTQAEPTKESCAKAQATNVEDLEMVGPFGEVF
jgi:hypothetical protein